MLSRPLRTALFAALLLLSGAALARAQEVTVFAAASLTNAMDEVSQVFSDKGLGKVTASYGASSTLAKQIENGAPADVFLSADAEWMDYLAERKLVDVHSRENLLGNTLVLVTPADAGMPQVDLTHGPGLAALLGNGRLATGDPAHVPAGKYAKEALTNLGQWTAVEPKLARANDVRSALVMVERAEAPLGIVYGTDAALSRKVKVLAVFPADSHAPIVYPAALVSGRETPTAQVFLRFLKGEDARRIFSKYGFTPLS